jgi:multidrug efflux pump subunit AcrA (membrane-fusion protein)
MTTETLEAITKAEAAAQEAAAKAIAAAQIAQARAEDARQRAEEERARAYKAFLDKVSKEWPLAREAAVAVVAESHATLVAAVRSGDDVFGAYLNWAHATVQAWSLDSELAQIRNHHGVPVRSTDPPSFRFDVDISAIIDRIAGEMQDEAVTRITDRRSAFVNGRVS